MASRVADENPKDAIGSKKPPMSAVPANVLRELGVAMLEGAVKYGRHNYRVAPIRASVYYDAVLRHIIKWWEGEDIDPDSGLHHLVKAVACLVVVRDAMLQETIIDDRPPPQTIDNFERYLTGLVEDIIDSCENPRAPYTKSSVSGTSLERKTTDENTENHQG